MLQVTFGWEDAHLHRFTPGDTFAPLRPVDGEIPEVQQWLRTGDRPEEDYLLEELPAPGAGTAYYEGFPGYEAFADPSHPGHTEHTARNSRHDNLRWAF